MFPTRFFPDRMFAPRYWPKVGETGVSVDPVADYTVRARADVSRIRARQDVSTIRAVQDPDVEGRI